MRELFGFPDSGTHQAGFWILDFGLNANLACAAEI